MKMPWTKRAERAERRALEAQERFDEVRRQWADVHAVTRPAHKQSDRNHWTNDIRTIFSGGQQGGTP